MKKLGLIISVLSLFTSLSAQIYHETINFENNSSLLWLDPSQEDNIWEIGTPQKEYFNQAYSLPFAILTDSLSLYGENGLFELIELAKKYGWKIFDTGLGEMIDLDNWQNHIDGQVRPFLCIKLCNISSRPLITGIERKPLSHTIQFITQTGIAVFPVLVNHV